MTGPADTFMRLYIGDYIADTSHLSTLEHGAYLLLMFHYWRTGPLPDGDEALARIARLSRSQWESIAADIRPFFRSATIDGASVLTHKRIDAELESAIGQYESRKSAAFKSHETRNTKSGGPPFEKRKKRCNAHAVIPSPYGEGGKEDGPLKNGAASIAKGKYENAIAMLSAEMGEGSTVWLIGAMALEDDDGKLVLTVPKRVQADNLKSRWWHKLDKLFGDGKWTVEIQQSDQVAA